MGLGNLLTTIGRINKGSVLGQNERTCNTDPLVCLVDDLSDLQATFQGRSTLETCDGAGLQDSCNHSRVYSKDAALSH